MNKIREELVLTPTGDHTRVDPNRDYPYNNDKCFKTLTARVSFSILDLFKPAAVITMHGGIETFGWPWGSNNHASDYHTVDNDLFEYIALEANKSLNWKERHNGEYNMFGIINSGSIYAVDGTLEDMAYGTDVKTNVSATKVCKE